MKVKINLATTKDAVKVSKIANRFDCPIYITDGHTLKVDAKSVLGMFYAFEFEHTYLECEQDVHEPFKKYLEESEYSAIPNIIAEELIHEN